MFNFGGLAANAVLSQTVATTAGVRYRLRFDYAVQGSIAGETQSVRVQALNGAASLLDQTLTHGSFNPCRWKAFTYEFVATGPTTTVRFTDLGPGNNSEGLLDSVTLAPVTYD